MAQHHAVARTVAIGHQFALLHVGHLLDDAPPFLGSVAVGLGIAAREQSLVIDLQFGGEHRHVPVTEERLDPLADASAHHEHLVAGLERLVHGHLGPVAHQIGVGGTEVLAQLLEPVIRHALEEVGQQPLLGLAPLEDAQFEQDNPRQAHEQPRQIAFPAEGVLQHQRQGIMPGVGAVKVKCYRASHDQQYMMSRNAMNHPSRHSWMKRSRNSTRVGLPLRFSTTVICR